MFLDDGILTWPTARSRFDPLDMEMKERGQFGARRRRRGRTPHYDGVKKGEPSPVVIGIVGLAPIDLKLVDPGSRRGGRAGHASLFPLPLAGEGRGEGDRMECGRGCARSAVEGGEGSSSRLTQVGHCSDFRRYV